MQQNEKRVGGFKVKRNVTLPLFKWKNDQERYYTCQGAMYIGKAVEKAGADGKKKDPATLMHVIDLETGELGQIICGKVLQGILNEDYPNDSYVGKSFAITQYRTPEKDYNYYTVTEIEPDEAQQEAEPTAKPAKGKK